MIASLIAMKSINANMAVGLSEEANMVAAWCVLYCRKQSSFATGWMMWRPGQQQRQQRVRSKWKRMRRWGHSCQEMALLRQLRATWVDSCYLEKETGEGLV